MFSNNENEIFRATAKKMAYLLFWDNKYVVCDPTNVDEIISEAMTIMLKRWKTSGRNADDLKDGYIYDLLSDAAERLRFIPKNRGPLEPAQLVGMTHCNECKANFDWEEARWSVKNGLRQNKALCPVCGVFLVTSKIIIPVNLISDSDSDDDDDSCLTPTTPCIEQILCGRDSKHYQVDDEFYTIDDNIITDRRIHTLLKPGVAPKWFPQYAQLIMNTEMNQGQIAKELEMTDAKLSAELRNFKGTAQVFCGGIRTTFRKKHTKQKNAQQSMQLGLFD